MPVAGLTITEELTGSMWMLPPQATPLSFNSWPPGIYTVVNQSGSNASVVLFGQTYTVGNNSKWLFVANENLAGVRQTHGARPPGRRVF